MVRDTGVRTNIGTGSPSLNAAAVEGLSQDGAAAAGSSYGQAGGLLAGWRWTAAGGIQLLPGWVTAHGISGDGNTVVGTAGTGSTAVVWHNGVSSVLPVPAGTTGPFGTSAWQTNFDGSRIVGSSGNNAAVWVNGQGSLLPLLSGYNVARASDLSDDGSLIIGFADPGAIQSPVFVWTPARGTELLSTYFASFGVSLPAGNTIFSAVVTPDGRTFGVTTVNGDRTASFGFIVSVPSPAGFSCMLLGVAATRRRTR